MATSRPPFKIPGGFNARENLQWVQRTVPDYSDGDKRGWPGSNYRSASETFYLCYLGQEWARKDGIAEEGMKQ
jgi:hypothetical protein